MLLIEPDRVKFPYAGWIPTANGQLSFRHIGEARHPTESVYANVTIDDCRIIIAYQRRPLSDALFQRIIHRVYRLEGSFWFALSGRSFRVSNETTEIDGAIFIYKSPEDWIDKSENNIKAVISKINSIRLSIEKDRDDIIEKEFVRETDNLNKTADIKINFHLKRSGELYLSTPLFSDRRLENASVEYANHSGHDFSRWVADQGYFFLRDLAHQHQHHYPSSDTILILQERTSNKVEWRRNIIYSLYYSIIRVRRFSDSKSNFQALGIHAYCLSFKEICKRSLGSDFNLIPTYNDTALLQSLSAKSAEESNKIGQSSSNAMIKLTRAGIRRTYALALSAIIIAVLIMFIQPLINSDTPNKFSTLSRFIGEHIIPVLAVPMGVMILTWMWTRQDWKNTNQFARDILELSNVRRNVFIIGYLIGGVLILLITFYFSLSALRDLMDAVSAFITILHT